MECFIRRWSRQYYFWGIDLGLVRGDVLEFGGGAHEITKADNGAEDRASYGRDLLTFGSREGS